VSAAATLLPSAGCCLSSCLTRPLLKLSNALHPATPKLKTPTCRQQEQKKARKEAEKQEKAKAAEQKQKSIQQMLAGMSEEEQAAWHQKNKV
jgi:hypothetical protein